MHDIGGALIKHVSVESFLPGDAPVDGILPLFVAAPSIQLVSRNIARCKLLYVGDGTADRISLLLIGGAYH